MYFPNTHAIIYVVDSSDKQRLNKAAEELNKVLEVHFFSFRKKLSSQYLYSCWEISKIFKNVRPKNSLVKCWDYPGSKREIGPSLNARPRQGRA